MWHVHSVIISMTISGTCIAASFYTATIMIRAFFIRSPFKSPVSLCISSCILPIPSLQRAWKIFGPALIFLRPTLGFFAATWILLKQLWNPFESWWRPLVPFADIEKEELCYSCPEKNVVRWIENWLDASLHSTPRLMHAISYYFTSSIAESRIQEVIRCPKKKPRTDVESTEKIRSARNLKPLKKKVDQCSQ